MKLLLVAGARPNYMKIAPIYWAVASGARKDLDVELVHTGQHYDAAMSDNFFRDLELPEPSVNLGVGSGSHAEQTAAVMTGFERVVLERRPDAVVVVGDVNSTLACALVVPKIAYDAAGTRPLLVHVEAGLRSHDRTMPEEINRVLTDAVSDVLFTTSRDGDENLVAEGIARERIHFVGNPMIDSLRRCAARAEPSVLRDLGLTDRSFAVCTLHRPSNVDRAEVLQEILNTLQEVAEELPVLLPLHPRTRQRIQQFGLHERVASITRPVREVPCRGLLALEPLTYLEMLAALQSARCVFTDSGGIQEETTALGVPCVTLRENTERPVTITEGTNVLGGTTRAGILAALAASRAKAANGTRVPELWDGHAGMRIVEVLGRMGMECRR
jgi:UDP-N-acetylglucosamine 2-epimerase (non-hydrolysing)